MNEKKTSFGYIIKLALSNILNHKRHMFIIIFGFIISISLLLSVNTWSRTSEDLAITDFLETQDFQAYIFSAQKPEDIELVKEDLDKNSLVDAYTNAYVTQALFNTEGKPDNYICLPEDEQSNPDDPVSITNAFIANQSSLDRISFMFNIEGNFTIDNNGIIISLQQKNELSQIYNKEINVGDILNISIARHIPIPAYGQNSLGNFELKFCENFRVNGIYTIQEGISILQSVVNVEWLSDSLIFPINALNSFDIDEMTVNDIPYLLFIKFNKYELTKDGLNQVIDKMQLFSEQIKKDYPSMYIYTLDAPLETLILAYTRASFTNVFLLPVILIGIIMTVLATNIVIKSREKEVALLRDRGADTFQIILLFVVEFIIVSLIGTIIGIALSFPLAGLLPSFTSSGFSFEIFIKFITHANFSFGFGILLVLGLIIILVGYASVKIWWEISQRYKNHESEKNSKNKIERNLIIGITIGLASAVIIALGFSLIDTIRTIRRNKSFSIENTNNAGYTFILFILLLIFLALAISYFISDKLQANLKNFYKRLIFTDTFFLNNNFKRKDKKLNRMTFSIVIVSSVIVFTLISASSITINQQFENEFKNGADIRVVTFPLEYSFKNNLSRIEGINEVVPIIKSKGSIAYDDYTIYGIDPIEYTRVGRWSESSFPEGYSFSNFQEMEEQYNGIIISEALSKRLNVTVGDLLPITNLPSGIYFRRFIVKGIIVSAPGFGLADGANAELLQPNRGFVLMNNEYMINELGLTKCQLFFASVLPGEDINSIDSEIENLIPNIEVNPPLINEKFIGAFIELYIPKVQTFFWIALVAIIIIIVILVIMVTEFTLNQRSQEYAITLSLGSSRRRLSKLIITEAVIIFITASLGGIILGLVFTYSTFYLLIPLFTAHNIIPYTINVPLYQIAIIPIVITVIALIGILPSIIKHGKENIIQALRS
ncbi:MAG: FtsX-like permease family protein [Asgard group archaeon]|nr:FtsX-like permease family protein [Asgard group archaeon]